MAAAVLLMAVVAPAFAEKRVALVVGNSGYKNTLALSNPVNDAEDVAAALKSIGFEVLLERNLTRRAMESAIARFGRLALDADAALVFYAGHGMQFRGQNFLMPVDAKLEDEFSLNFELNKVDDLMVGLDRARGVKILILDACRNNPLAERLSRTARARDFMLSRGLAKIEPTRGMVIAYSTQPNQIALDGDGRNSPFASALVKEMAEPGLEIGTLFRRVARAVDKETDGKQLPELSVSLVGDFYLNTRETDLQTWGRIRTSERAGDFRDFIRNHPKSVFLGDARRQLDIIETAERARLAQERARQEAAARAEEERKRLAAEQAAKAEAERKRVTEERAAQEKAAREAVQRAEAERKRLTEEKAAQEKAQREAATKLEEERKRAAADREKSTTQLAALAPTTEPAANKPTPEGTALIREIKAELKRVGCYSGALDDKWATTKDSAGRFVKLAKVSVAPNEPGKELLDAIRGKSDRICPLECGRREMEKDGRCVAKSCPSGQKLDDAGRCKLQGESSTASLPPDTRNPTTRENKTAGNAGCSAMKDKVRCTCAVQNGGFLIGRGYRPPRASQADGFYRCLIAHGRQ